MDSGVRLRGYLHRETIMTSKCRAFSECVTATAPIVLTCLHPVSFFRNIFTAEQTTKMSIYSESLLVMAREHYMPGVGPIGEIVGDCST